MLGRRQRTDARLARLLVLATITMGAAVVVLGFAPTVVVAAAASLVVGIGNGLLNVLGQTLMVRRTPRVALGRVFSVVQAVAGAGGLVAAALGGVLLAVLDVRTVVVASGVATVLSLVVVGRSLVRAAAQPAPAVPSGADADDVLAEAA